MSAHDATTRPTYTVGLRPERGVDGPQALRQALRVLLRRFGLRCLQCDRQAQDGCSASVEVRDGVELDWVASPDGADDQDEQTRGQAAPNGQSVYQTDSTTSDTTTNIPTHDTKNRDLQRRQGPTAARSHGGSHELRSETP